MVDTQLAQLSLLLVYGAMAAYGVALIAAAVDLFGDRIEGARSRAAGIARMTTLLGAILHGIGIVLRGLAAGRVPWANMYEFTLVFSFVAVVAYLVLSERWRIRLLGTLVVGLVLLMLGVAVAVLYVRADGLPPALDSYWLVIHVSVATLAIGIFAVSALLAVLQLVVDSAERRDLAATRGSGGSPGVTGAAEGAVASADGPVSGSTVATATAARAATAAGRAPTGAWGRAWQRLRTALPSAAQLERRVFRLNGVAFVLWTFTLIAGAIWAEHAWGRPWGWDAKEAWSFGIWVVYAAYLHARTTRGWQGRRSAYLTLVGFALILGNYFVVNLLLNSRHAYSGIG